MKLHPAALWRRNEKRKKFFGEMGVVIGFSVVRQAPVQLAERTPYIVALVEVDSPVGGQKIVAQLVECEAENVVVGMKVVGVMRKLFDVDSDALHVYGVKFAPLRSDIE